MLSKIWRQKSEFFLYCILVYCISLHYWYQMSKFEGYNWLEWKLYAFQIEFSTPEIRISWYTSLIVFNLSWYEVSKFEGYKMLIITLPPPTHTHTKSCPKENHYFGEKGFRQHECHVTLDTSCDIRKIKRWSLRGFPFGCCRGANCFESSGNSPLPRLRNIPCDVLTPSHLRDESVPIGIPPNNWEH